MNYPAAVPGDLTGVNFPTSVAALEEMGTAFLTEAFRATGAIAPNNSVVAITNSSEFFGGGMGRKLWLDVTYEKPGPGLHERLFVKYTREFGDPLRELFSPVMEPETRFALLSRRDDFPVAVPTCYFADYHAETKSGLLITERILYGQNGIEPAHDKSLDYLVVDPLDHYEAQARAMASLAAHHRAGRFGDAIARQFPFDPNGSEGPSMIPYTADQLEEKLTKLRSFAKQAPQLLPSELRSEAFFDSLAAEVPLVLKHERALRAHLDGQDDLIALCHWNMNIDNAWFWRGEDGVLRSGLLDWGGVSQMNLAKSFFGMICAAETDFLDSHEDTLLRLVIEEYRKRGGPAVDRARFELSMRLGMALDGVAWMLDAPSLIEAEIPDYATLADRFDPVIRDKFIPRAQLQLMTTFLHLWRTRDVGTLLKDFVGERQTP